VDAGYFSLLDSFSNCWVRQVLMLFSAHRLIQPGELRFVTREGGVNLRAGLITAVGQLVQPFVNAAGAKPTLY